MNRRQLIASLIAMPAALETLRRRGAGPPGQPIQPILGPTVFEWDQMKPVKTATGEVRSLCKQPTATLAQLEMHITTLDPGNVFASAASPRERGTHCPSRGPLRNALRWQMDQG